LREVLGLSPIDDSDHPQPCHFWADSMQAKTEGLWKNFESEFIDESPPQEDEN